MSRVRTGLAALVLLLSSGAAMAGCRQALALGLDVSGSVDSAEYRLQLTGLAAALSDTKVARALLSDPAAPVRIAVYEWSDAEFQRLLVDWVAVIDQATLDRIVARIAGTRRSAAPPGTALGEAMWFGAALLADQADCPVRTLDLSGDGPHNTGPHPRDVRQDWQDRARGTLTLNALVIGPEPAAEINPRGQTGGDLAAYFKAWVVFGPGGFVETAHGFDDYRAAMTRKLLRELQGMVLSASTVAATGTRRSP